MGSVDANSDTRGMLESIDGNLLSLEIHKLGDGLPRSTSAMFVSDKALAVGAIAAGSSAKGQTLALQRESANATPGFEGYWGGKQSGTANIVLYLQANEWQHPQVDTKPL